ncbi:MAG: 2-dehydropantoate 2-reductase [bacterium]
MIKRVLVVGAGAVGIYYGVLLSKAGLKLTFCCRSDYEVAKEQGFALHYQDEKETFMLPVIDQVENYLMFGDSPDLILIATKALPEIDLANLLGPVVGPNTCFLLIQNGLDVEVALSEVFPKNRLLSAVAFSCLNRVSAAQVRYLGFNRLTLGSYPDGGVTKEALFLKKCFDSQGVPCRVSEHMQYQRWKKLLWNVPFNALSVLAGGLTTADLLSSRDFSDQILTIMKEVQQLAAGDGYELPDHVIEQNISETKDKMGAYKTSMLLDFEAGRALEIEAIYGVLFRKAGDLGLELPFISSLYTRLKALG